MEDTHASGIAATAATTSTATTATATTTARSSAAGSLSARTLSVGALGLLTSRLGLASELNRNLSLKNLLARELSNGTVSLVGSREVDKGVADRAVSAGVLGDRDRLAAKIGLSAHALYDGMQWNKVDETAE